MSKGTAANLSIAMAILMWPLGAMGILFMLADPRQDMTAQQVAVMKSTWVGLPLTIAFAFLICSAWLSGYSFAEAKRRALTSAVICSGFVVVVFWNLTIAPLTKH